MIKLLLIQILLISSASYATTGEDLLKISKQFQNRNWNYNAALYARHAHLADYSNVELLEESKSLIQIFVDNLQVISGEVASVFYPESGIESENDRIVVKDSFLSVVKSYDILLDWDSFLTALGTNRWEDLESCDISDPINDLGCGRETKGNWAVAHLTDYQRQNLSAFKQVVLGELQLIEANDFGVPVGPGAARVFQFLFDSRSIPLLLQRSYAFSQDLSDPDLAKMNKVDLLRAVIVQLFQEQGGRRYDSSSNVIELTSAECSSKDVDCELEYMRELFIDPTLSYSLTAKNLFLDQKLVKPLMDSFVAHLRSSGTVIIPQEKMENFLKKIYFSICELQGINPLSPDMSQAYKLRVIDQLKFASEYLINNRDIAGLQVAKGLQTLIRFIEAQE